uniref:lysozyme n=1 Tax=Astyanax mexicanus TaxID=7994 RepID=A0A3B1KKD2_ASTMX
MRIWVLLLLVAAVSTKRFTKCELVRTLKAAGMDDFFSVSLAHSLKTNTNGMYTEHYGIFQINNRRWCSDGKFPGKKDCPFTCNRKSSVHIFKLFSLQNSIDCAKIIVQKLGMTPWKGWRYECWGQDVSKYVAGCGV